MFKRIPNYQHISQIFEELKSDIKKRTEKPEFSFGLYSLDEATRGMRRGRVHIIAARPGEGKTSLALQTAWNLADAGKVIVYVSLEDDKKRLTERMFCNMQKINNADLARGAWTDETEKKSEAMASMFKNITFLVMDGFGYNWPEFENVLDSIKPQADVAFLDYINMIELSGSQNKRDTVSEFVRNCKAFALKKNMALVILAQINRSGADDSRPGLHHLKDSGTLEEVADLVLINHFPIRYNNKTFKGEFAGPEYFEIMVAKIKDYGHPKVVPVRFAGRYYRFDDVEQPLFKFQPKPESFGAEVYQ